MDFGQYTLSCSTCLPTPATSCTLAATAALDGEGSTTAKISSVRATLDLNSIGMFLAVQQDLAIDRERDCVIERLMHCY